MFALIPLIQSLIKVMPKLIQGFKNLAVSSAGSVIRQSGQIMKNTKTVISKNKKGLKNFGSQVGAGIVGGGLVAGGVNALDDSDDQGLELLTNADSTISDNSICTVFVISLPPILLLNK